MTAREKPGRRPQEPLRVVRPRPAGAAVLITGGAGFVGTNLAHRLLSRGESVLVLDNLSRPGVERNLRWLCAAHPDGVRVEVADVRDAAAVARAVAQARQVFHCAAQVAVTTSLSDPLEDFDVNARGTLNVLEALRALSDPPPLIFTSTNKVYGGLEDIELVRRADRYEPVDGELREHGIDESRPLDFHTPYGCSKGAADQYVLDYARSFGIDAVVFRMSCIYGPHQCGTEDQGWVAHFALRALRGEPITLYGDGLQVRDVLFIDDLLDAFDLACENMHRIAGRAFNIGGGPANAVSLLEVVDAIGTLSGKRPVIEFGAWRAGDQRYYVSDTRAFRAATGWEPRVSVHEGTSRLCDWLRQVEGMRSKVHASEPA
ncbi:MAG TPA: NAD-dependent epimerase/dehydratase family protein [Longimicrobiales bacterium]